MEKQPGFDIEVTRRSQQSVVSYTNNSDLLKKLAYLVAFSQNVNSALVETLLESGQFDAAFDNFEIDAVAKMNPCDIVDNHWRAIGGIGKQAKLFFIVILARKLKHVGCVPDIISSCDIPTRLLSAEDVTKFWTGFDKLQRVLKESAIPFFRNTTILLHFLMDAGYDCVKPDVIVMKVAKKLGIVNETKDDNNLRTVVKTIQLFALDRRIRPSFIDLCFLIDGRQRGAKKYLHCK